MDSVLDTGVAEERRNELTAALRLVAAAEAAGDHDDLCLTNHCRKGGDRIFHCRCGQVADDKGLRSCTGTLKDAGGVVFAVGAGEYRNQHAGLCTLDRSGQRGLSRIGQLFRNLCGGLDAAGEYRFQLLLPDGQQLVQLEGEFRADDLRLFAGGADHVLAVLCIAAEFQQEAAAAGLEQFCICQLAVKGEADAVAEAHLGNTFCHAAVVDDPAGTNAAGGDHCFDLVECGTNALEAGDTVFVSFRTEHHDLVASLLEFGGNHLVCLGGGNSKGYQRRRNIDVLERTGHGVLTADRAAGQFQLCLECTQQGSHGLAPTLGIILGTLEVFLECQPAVVPAAAGCNDLGNGGDDCVHGTQIGVAFADRGIIAPAHERAGVGFALEHRNLGSHCL